MVLPAETSKPNVLFIAIDDLNDWIEPLGGHPQAKTPNLTRLARQSTLFTRAYCAAPACNPSRAALMTGIRPSTSGVYHNPQPWRLAMPDVVTLSQHFMNQGYWAGGSGKIYHGSYPDPESWNDFFPSKKSQRPPGARPKKTPLSSLKNTAHFDWGPLPDEDSAMSDAKVANWVIDQLGVKDRDKPFFLAFGLYRPHLPWYVPQKYFDMFPLDSIQLPRVQKNDLEDVPPAGVKMARPDGDHKKVTANNEWKKAVQGYLASIAFTDAQLGRVLDAFEKSAHAKNTIVILWTDHGWHLGEKEHWRKFALWEDATRTPMMIKAPSGVPGLPAGTKAGTRCEHPVSLMDIYPTLVDLAGLPKPDHLEGTSLVPLLGDPSKKEWDRPALTTHGRNNHALRSLRWRYIRYADGTEELYDHSVDPHEWANVAKNSAHDSVKARLAKHFPKKNAADAAYDPRKTRKAQKKKKRSGASKGAASKSANP